MTRADALKSLSYFKHPVPTFQATWPLPLGVPASVLGERLCRRLDAILPYDADVWWSIEVRDGVAVVQARRASATDDEVLRCIGPPLELLHLDDDAYARQADGRG